MYITENDLKIVIQSQTQRAIELVDTIGFPPNIRNQHDQVKYIFDTLVPYLTKKIYQNTDKIANELIYGEEEEEKEEAKGEEVEPKPEEKEKEVNPDDSEQQGQNNNGTNSEANLDFE